MLSNQGKKEGQPEEYLSRDEDMVMEERNEHVGG